MEENSMKIPDNNFFNIQSSVKAQMKTSTRTFDNTFKAKSSNCDEIIISSKAGHTDSDDFAKNITNKIRDEVNTPVNEKTLESLKSQIEEGTYKIDTDEIVKKFMLN
jgi:anti-sigma28 factor (negative regulator of flagellin synthesis)